MAELEVRIVQLEPMRMASAYGFGKEPEMMASQKMAEFVEKHGLVKADGSYTSFGFNNPNPAAGSPNYGYEVWVEVGPDVQPEGDIRVINFCGGKYAVTRFSGLSNIGRVWQELAAWREQHGLEQAHHQWLEHLFNPQESDEAKHTFDLYLPVK